MDELPESSTPDVVVWQADGRPWRGRGYGGPLATRLRRLGARVTVVDYRRRALTAAEHAAPVHVLSGGDTSAFSEDDATTRALAELREVARRAWADEATLIGICLGAQLIARAVAPGLDRRAPAHGMEAGWRRVVGPDGPIHVAEFHYEEIHPAIGRLGGVTVTHGNGHSPVQAFRWGPATSAMQFHPEWSPTELRSVLGRHRDLLAARHRRPAEALASIPRRAPRHRTDPFAELVARPVVRRLRTARRRAARAS